MNDKKTCMTCDTIVNCIKYSSALDICQSHNITMIPATTSKAIVHLYTLKQKYTILSNVAKRAMNLLRNWRLFYLFPVSFSKLIAQK